MARSTSARRDVAPTGGALVVRLPLANTDAALVAALRAQRRDGAEALLDRYGRHVRRVLERVLGPEEEYGDAVCRVFVAAFDSARALEDPSTLRPWLTRLAVSEARRRLARRRGWRSLLFRERPALSPASATDLDGEVMEAVRATYRLLDRLPIEERIVFALRFVDGMELSEVARAAGSSFGAVMRRLSRAHQKFLALAADEPSLTDWLGAWSRSDGVATLGRAIAEELELNDALAPLDRTRRDFLRHLDRTLDRQERRRTEPRLARERLLLAVSTAAVLGGAVALHFQRTRPALTFVVEGHPEPPPLGAWLAAPIDAPLPIDFSDGSRVELAAGARGRVLEVHRGAAHVLLERGGASLQGGEGAETRFRVSAGPFVLAGAGAELELSWDPEGDELVLRLDRGRVTLAGCTFEEGRWVLPGETVRAACSARRFEMTRASSVR